MSHPHIAPREPEWLAGIREGNATAFEGVFRNHMIMPDGSIRHSAYFSITADDWPAVKARLTARLSAGLDRRP